MCDPRWPSGSIRSHFVGGSIRLFNVRADRSCAEVHIHRLAMPPSSRMFVRSIMHLGVIAVTPDALCVKHLSDAGADVLCIIA